MENKNTVRSDIQLRANEYVTFEGDGELKIMFVGNSITRHGVLEDIGWLWDHGMAASSKENDYIHIIMKAIDEKTSAQYCICQAANWECHHREPEWLMEQYASARDFGADIIIMRVVENCISTFDKELFIKNYPELIRYLNSNNAKLIFTSGFWKHDEADKAIEQIAKDCNSPFIYLGDLGDNPEMRADGKFWHQGVQYHPGDKGMKSIAERILAELEKII